MLRILVTGGDGRFAQELKKTVENFAKTIEILAGTMEFVLLFFYLLSNS